MWTEENSQQYVIAVLRVLNKHVEDELWRKTFTHSAHTKAQKALTRNQAQYDLAFANALRDEMANEDICGVPLEALTDNALFAMLQAPLPALQPSVATAEPVEQPKPADDRSNWTVEDWERSGVQFRPAATRVANILQQPVEDRTRRAKPTYANNLPEAPWGSRAVAMVKWAWIQAFPSERLGGNRADEIAHILSVLYHAGILKEGSITPVGMGRAKIVRGKPTKL